MFLFVCVCVCARACVLCVLCVCLCEADNLIVGQTEEDKERRGVEDGCGGFWEREVAWLSPARACLFKDTCSTCS